MEFRVYGLIATQIAEGDNFIAKVINVDGRKVIQMESKN